jgi:hypothetical protein
MALELLEHLRPSASQHRSLEKARSFACYNDFHVDFVADHMSVGSGLLDQAPTPVCGHAVEVWSHRTTLMARVILFGQLKVTATLTTSWDGPAVTLLHVLDPCSPANTRTLGVEGDGPLLALWCKEIGTQAMAAFTQHIGAVSQRVADANSAPFEREPGPSSLDELYPLVVEEYEKLAKKKKGKEERRGHRSTKSVSSKSSR